MAEPQVLSTLRHKQKDVPSYIRDLERRLAQAQPDLAHATPPRLFEIGDRQPQVPIYASNRRVPSGKTEVRGSSISSGY